MHRRGIEIGVAVLVVLGLGILGWRVVEARRAMGIQGEARAALQGGRYGRAEQVTAQALRNGQNSAALWELRARALIGLGRDDEASEALATAVQRGLDGEPAMLLRALLAARARHDPAAEPILRRAAERSPQIDPLLAAVLSQLYLETFRIDLAAAVVKRWRGSAPDDPQALLRQAEIDRRTDAEPAALVADYQAALRLDPGLDAAQLGLADALKRAGRLADAARAYETYLAHTANDPAAHAGLAEVNHQRGDIEAAVRHYDRALELDPANRDAIQGRAGLAIQRLEWEHALALLDRTIQRDPDNAEAHYRRALVLSRLGRQEESQREQNESRRLRREQDEIQALRDDLLRAPNDPGPQLKIARWLIDHGHASEGLAWAEKVLAEKPSLPEAHLLLADYYEKHQDPGRANYHLFRAGKDRRPTR